MHHEAFRFSNHADSIRKRGKKGKKQFRVIDRVVRSEKKKGGDAPLVTKEEV